MSMEERRGQALRFASENKHIAGSVARFVIGATSPFREKPHAFQRQMRGELTPVINHLPV